MLETIPEFLSQYVLPRQVDVWLPPGYPEAGARRFPVLYMHDGQNLFSSSTAYGGFDWGIDPTFTHLIRMEAVRPAIVVGIWNTNLRWQEYLPNRPFETPHGKEALARLGSEFGDGPLADRYLRFIVAELIPYIDVHYRTLTGPDNTLIMGSSMGGLVSIYALCEYPQVFGRAGCLSTHWLPVQEVISPYLETALPGPGNHKLYFDYGTETLDRYYEPHQQKVDELLQQAGYSMGKDWQTLKFEGAEHSERAWRARLEIPLKFLLG